MPEVDAGLQQLAHGDDGHGYSFRACRRCPVGCADRPISTLTPTPARPVGTGWHGVDPGVDERCANFAAGTAMPSVYRVTWDARVRMSTDPPRDRAVTGLRCIDPVIVPLPLPPVRRWSSCAPSLRPGPGCPVTAGSIWRRNRRPCGPPAGQTFHRSDRRPPVVVVRSAGVRYTYEPVRPAWPWATRVAAGRRLGRLARGGHAGRCLHWGPATASTWTRCRSSAGRGPVLTPVRPVC